MVDVQYYKTKPVDSAEVNAAVRGFIDGVVGQILGVQNGSATISFLFKFFGPTDAASDFNKVISRDGEFVYLDGD